MRFLLFILFLYYHIASAQIQVTRSKNSPDLVKSSLQLVLKNKAKQNPLVFSEDVFSKLKLETPICNKVNLENALKNCTPLNCFRKSEASESSRIYSEVYVQGYNSTKNCVVSFQVSRYFIPQKDLKNFTRVFLDNFSQAQQETSSRSYDSSRDSGAPMDKVMRTVSVETFWVDRIPCRIHSRSRVEFDKRNTKVVKFFPPKSDGAEFTTVNGKELNYFTEAGVTYQIPSGPAKFVNRLEHFWLERGANQICKARNAAIIYDLKLKGLVEELPFRGTIFGMSSAVE